AGGKAADALLFFAARSQHDDRQRPRCLARPEAPAELDPRDARQHPVEEDEVGDIFAQPGLGFVAALDRIDGVALRLEAIAKHQRERLFVLDDHDAWGHVAHARLYSTEVIDEVSFFGRSSVSGVPLIR